MAAGSGADISNLADSSDEHPDGVASRSGMWQPSDARAPRSGWGGPPHRTAEVAISSVGMFAAFGSCCPLPLAGSPWWVDGLFSLGGCRGESSECANLTYRSG